MKLFAFDVVVVPFPYSDRLAEKRRPALVVSSERLQADLGRLWLALITSVVHAPGLGDALIADLRAAGLPAVSLVRGSKLATLDEGRVLRRVGRLASADRQAVLEALKACSAF